MTLQVKIDYVPFGDETKRETIELVEISNCGPPMDVAVKAIRRYKVVHGETKFRIFHDRDDGALELAWKALSVIVAKQ